tara:strand:+ start:997 stop:2658 length:1662 start_codon:yes stop_codon:yes gene_type:complete
MNDFENISLVPQLDFKIKLYKHQLASIYNMENLEEEQVVYCSDGLIKQTKVGLNCDCTGYGKTLSILGLITRDKMLWDLNTPFVVENIQTESGGLIITRKIKRYVKMPMNLVLVSSSLVHQWENEIKKTNLTYFIVSNKKKLEDMDLSIYNIVIVIPSVYNVLMQIYSKKAWKRFIYDEPGHLRVSGMKKITAGFYWLITATPEEIINQHKNCRESFMKKLLLDDGLTPIKSQFNGMIVKNREEFVKASFSMPRTFEYYHECYQPILKTLSGFVNNTLHKLIESGNIEGAINHLGGKTNNLIELVKQNKQDKLIKLNKKLSYLSSLEDIEESKFITIQKEIDNLNNDLDEIEKRTIEILKGNCSICMQVFSEPILETNCQNIFCGKCFLKWIEKSRSCPLCRADVCKDNIIYLTTNIKEKDNYIQEKEKKITQIEMVIKIIKEKKNGKFIIYSSNDISFEPICRVLNDNNILYTDVRGNYKFREKCIDEFKFGKTKVIFLNTKYNGSGLNLQEATDIILYHQMSDNLKNQIIGRANRIGREISLNVHYLKVNK